MNYKPNIRSISYSVLIFTLTFIFLVSCTKNSDKDKKTETSATDTISASDFRETNEDQLAVDYNYFYNELSGSGEWIEVSAKDIGIEIKPGKSDNSNPGINSLFSDLLGVKTAYAQTDAELFNLFVWRPATELASKMLTEGQQESGGYVPYNNGQWIYTDAGWYFKAETPQEDLTSHYGRWTFDQNLGWVWLPGRVWSPAWVEMRENDDYVAWAPVPPGAYIENNVITQTNINESRYTIVEKKMFMEPSVYKYRYQYVENKNKIMIKEMKKTDGVMVMNKTVINKGPDAISIEKSTGKKVKEVKINKVGKKEDVTTTPDAISVYTPEFKKVKEVKKEPVSKPQKLVSYKDAKKITKEEKGEMKQEEKEQKKEEKELKKEEKEKKKEEKEVKKEQKKEEKEMKKEDKKDKDQKNKDNKKDDDVIKKDNKKDDDIKMKDKGKK